MVPLFRNLASIGRYGGKMSGGTASGHTHNCCTGRINQYGVVEGNCGPSTHYKRCLPALRLRERGSKRRNDSK